MSQNDSVLATGRQRTLGACSVCLRQLCLTSTGVVHNHGPHDSPCAGSGCAPAVGSVTSPSSTLLAGATDAHDDSQQPSVDSQQQAELLLDALTEARRTPVLKYIPKASRVLAATKLTTVLDHVVTDPTNMKVWEQLLLFTYSCFGANKRAGKQHKQHKTSLATKVNKALSDYLFSGPRAEAAPAQTRTRKQKKKITPSELQNLAARVSSKIEEGDVRGAVRIASSDDKLAPYDDETVAALKLLHPPRATTSNPAQHIDNLSDSTSLPVLILTENDIVAAIKTFPAGSAGGLDGLRPQHLKDMTSPMTGDAGQQLVTSLMEFANVCLAGRIPAAVRPVFYGASLCALTKKGGGVRPIAVGSTLRRLVAKAACRIVREAVVAKLAPHQLGFGIQQGAEAAAHAARSLLANMGSGEAMLKIDFTNAFNTLSRDVMLSVIRDELPELFPFIDSCYSGQSFLIFGQYTLLSDEGPQQGDPLGPLLFCAATMRLVNRIKSVFNLWYMDDGTLGGHIDVLISDWKMLVEEGRKIGLVVNVTKCELITDDVEVIDKFRVVAQEIKVVSPAAAMLLGSPIGGEQSVDDVLAVKLQELRRLSNRLTLLNVHDALFLLKHCFSIPKLTYTLRSAPCYSSHLLTEYDAMIRSTLQSVLNVALSDEAWEQATLPVANGGLGIRRATDITLPAFLSSVAGSQALVSLLLPQHLQDVSGTNEASFKAALTQWQNQTGVAPVMSPFATAQKYWDAPLVMVQEKRVMSAATDQAGKARLIAAAAPHSGAFLHARPCAALGTRLDGTSLRIVVALRLGAPVCLPHVCICGAAVDSTGRHGLSCRKSAGRLSRHSAVNDLIKRALMSAEVPSRLEPRSLTQHDDRRPDGLSLTPWSGGKCLAWDFTCPDTLAVSHLNAAVTGPGVVATEAERQTRIKYACLTHAYHFVPVAVETLGALGEEASDFVHELGRRIATVTGEKRSTEFLLQRLSVAIQRGNASSVLGTVDSGAQSPNLDIVYYL